MITCVWDHLGLAWKKRYAATRPVPMEPPQLPQVQRAYVGKRYFLNDHCQIYVQPNADLTRLRTCGWRVLWRVVGSSVDTDIFVNGAFTKCLRLALLQD